MSKLADQMIVRGVRLLKSNPRAFRFVKRHLRGTFLHRIQQRAVRNTATHWDRTVAAIESKEARGWLDWEFVEIEHVRPQVSGDRSSHYLQYFLERHVPAAPVDRALSLGCGGGNLERALVGLNAAKAIDAYDASSQSIALATELAEREGIAGCLHYSVADIDTLELPARRYDFVVAKMSLHHFAALEHVFAQVRQSLKPGGVFMFNEYVGPTRFQWTDGQLEHMNRVLRVLPGRLRRSTVTGDELREVARPTVAEIVAMDPTEAIDSSRILPLLGKYFEVLEVRPYGGTLLHVLLNHVMANFDVTNDAEAALLRMIFLYERALIEKGVLASDFCYGVVRAPQSAR